MKETNDSAAQTHVDTEDQKSAGNRRLTGSAVSTTKSAKVKQKRKASPGAAGKREVTMSPELRAVLIKQREAFIPAVREGAKTHRIGVFRPER